MEKTKQEEKREVKHTSIFAALSALQGELHSVPRTKEVNFTTRTGQTVNFWYAPLDEIMDYLYPLLGKHGLAARHELSEKGVECVLTHETAGVKYDKEIEEHGATHTDERGTKFLSEKTQYVAQKHGELRSGVMKIKQDGDMKEFGGQITYARRYTLALVLGVATEEDTDIAIEEARKENIEKFALAQARKGISEAKTVAQIEEKEKFFGEEVKMLDSNKAPKLGFTLEQYIELAQMCSARKAQISKVGKQEEIIQVE